MDKKDKILAAQSRLDWYEDAIDYATSPAEKTAEGFLVARAPVTSIGVFLTATRTAPNAASSACPKKFSMPIRSPRYALSL